MNSRAPDLQNLQHTCSFSIAEQGNCGHSLQYEVLASEYDGCACSLID